MAKLALIISLSIFLSALSSSKAQFTFLEGSSPLPSPMYAPSYPDTDASAADDGRNAMTLFSIPAAPVASPPPPESLPGEVPKEEQDKDSKFLVSNMQATTSKVEEFISKVVEKRLKDPNTSEADKQCLSQCQEVYESAIDAMKKSLEDVNNSDFFKANVDVSAFSTNIDTCDECFRANIEPEFRKFDDWARGIANDFMDKIVKYSNVNM